MIDFICPLKTTFSDLISNRESKEPPCLSEIYAVATQIIHSQAVQGICIVASIGVITVLLTPNPVAWAVVAVVVGVIALAIFFFSDSDLVFEKEPIQKKIGIVPRDNQMSIRKIPADGNCFYSSFAVAVLEWIYEHKTDSEFSLKHFLKNVQEAKVEESFKTSVIEIIQKVELAKTTDDLEEIIGKRKNVFSLVRFFREMAAQGLEGLSKADKQVICADPDQVFSREGEEVSFSEVLDSVRKPENVSFDGWAFPQSISALSTKIGLPFRIWKSLPAQNDAKLVRQRSPSGNWTSVCLEDGERQVLTSAGADYSKGQAVSAHFILSGNHYDVLYGLTPQEVHSQCIVIK